MKKRIFICIQYLEIGGAERSLIGLLNAIDYSRCEVDLFVCRHTGEFMPLIPKEVRLLPEVKAYAAINRPIKDIVKEGSTGVALARLAAKVHYAVYARRNHPKEGSGIFQYVADWVAPFLPSLKGYGEYDLAISFLTPHNIVRDKVRAKKKMAWVHTDYSTISVNVRRELPVWDSFDRIAAVSEGVRQTFVQTFPRLEGKMCVVENILAAEFVRAQAALDDVSAEMPRTDGELILCSAGRFCYAKNFDNVPFLCRLLADKGIRFKWYIVGYGGDEALILENRRKAGMEEQCILLGKKQNPYPYIRACDWYVQPSRFEGKSVVVREAQMLCKPVVITAYPTAAAQIHNGLDGVIVPMPQEECADGMAAAFRNEELRTKIVDHLRRHDFGNEAEVEKIYTIMNTK